MHVVLDSLASSLGRSLEQRAHIYVEATVGISRSYHLGTTVVTILSHLRNHDTRLTALFLGKFFAQFRCPNEIGIFFGF